MIINDFRPQSSGSFVKALIYVAIIVGIGVIAYFGVDVVRNLGSVIAGKSAISVNVQDGEAEVFLNDAPLGKTPYESTEIESQDNKITVKGRESTYEVSIPFIPNTQVVINRDLGTSDIFSSGQNFWIEKSDSSSVLSVITDPSNVFVYIDNTKVGETPFSSDNLGDGGYDLRVEAPGYEPQSARIKIQKGHKLNVTAKLFPVPVPSKVSLMEGSEDIYDVASENALVTANSAEWAKAVVYWNRTRGINLAGAGVNKEAVFGYFVSYDGGVFDAEGKMVNVGDIEQALKEGGRVAYLRRVAEGVGLTDAAKAAFDEIASALKGGKKVKILETGTGWLRVRDAAGLDGKEIGRVNVGGEYAVLEESGGWVRIKVDDKTDGWVSSSYVQMSE